MDKVTRQCPQLNHNLFEEKGEPKRYRSEVLPLTSLKTGFGGHKTRYTPVGKGDNYNLVPSVVSHVSRSEQICQISLL